MIMQYPEECIGFNDILIKSIDETITSLLSSEVVEALYAHIERVHSISKDNIIGHLDVLTSTLAQIFGSPGSGTISRAIARAFYFRLGLSFSAQESRTLIEYVEAAKMKLRDRRIQI